MHLSLDFNPVSLEPADYGRYPVLVRNGEHLDLGMAHFTHPAGAQKEGWFQSEDRGAQSVSVVGWSLSPVAPQQVA